jgi:hypothetical protein
MELSVNFIINKITILQSSKTDIINHAFAALFRMSVYIINPILPLCIYIASCNTTTQPNNIPLTEINTKYKILKQQINNTKLQIAKQHKSVDANNSQKIAKQFIQLFEQKMVPAWLGTAWNFNGTTTTPLTGQIACGYFVTTTLLHMGYPIDRVKYAQCASSQMMKYLVDSTHYKNYSPNSFDFFITKLKKKEDFLAVIGLDKHTGYLLKSNNQLYFVHSSYIGNRGVVKQIAQYSNELKGSRWRSVAFLTEDKFFLEKWLRGS